MGDGYGFLRSPNGKLTAFYTPAFDSFHTIEIWDEQKKESTKVLSIREGDPGSGVSHNIAWSDDSEVLFVIA